MTLTLLGTNGYLALLGALLLVLMAGVTAYVLRLNRQLNAEVRERRRSEVELRKLSGAVEQTADIVVITDRNGIIEYVNRAFEQTTGLQRSEAIGRSPAIVKSNLHDRDFYQRLWQTINAGDAFHAVFINRRKDQTLYYEQKTITPLRDADGNIVNFVSTSKDVTERRVAEERAREHQAALAHALRVSTMGEMASGIAHELNQPLAAIMNYAQGCVRRIQARPKEDPVALRGALRHIVSQGERAAEIIRRLREFVRKSDPQWEQVQINEIVEAAAQFANMAGREKGVEVKLELTPELPTVTGDDIQLEQVTLNLVRNAIDALADPACATKALTIRSATNAQGHVEVSIHDTGPGFTANEPEQLFEAFFTTKPDGMGMGLSISRSIIEAHGGRISAHSEPGRGTTFRFWLPAVGQSPAREGCAEHGDTVQLSLALVGRITNLQKRRAVSSFRANSKSKSGTDR